MFRIFSEIIRMWSKTIGVSGLMLATCCFKEITVAFGSLFDLENLLKVLFFGCHFLKLAKQDLCFKKVWDTRLLGFVTRWKYKNMTRGCNKLRYHDQEIKSTCFVLCRPSKAGSRRAVLYFSHMTTKKQRLFDEIYQKCIVCFRLYIPKWEKSLVPLKIHYRMLSGNVIIIHPCTTTTYGLFKCSM